MLDEREKDILSMLVREYIKSAVPVSSERIAERFRGAVSPATIRNIFTELTDEGYIEQPHTSGGRVPRTAGYRFFVERLLDEEAHSPLPRAITDMIEEMERGVRYLAELQREMAHRFHVLSGVAGAQPIGFPEIFKEPEFEEQKHMREFGSFLDAFERYEERYAPQLDQRSFTLIIGEENNIQPVSSISVVMTKVAGGEILFIAGPTRMNYDQIMSIMKLWKKTEIKKKKPRT